MSCSSGPGAPGTGPAVPGTGPIVGSTPISGIVAVPAVGEVIGRVSAVASVSPGSGATGMGRSTVRVASPGGVVGVGVAGVGSPRPNQRDTPQWRSAAGPDPETGWRRTDRRPDHRNDGVRTAASALVRSVG